MWRIVAKLSLLFLLIGSFEVWCRCHSCMVFFSFMQSCRTRNWPTGTFINDSQERLYKPASEGQQFLFELSRLWIVVGENICVLCDSVVRITLNELVFWFIRVPVIHMAILIHCKAASQSCFGDVSQFLNITEVYFDKWMFDVKYLQRWAGKRRRSWEPEERYKGSRLDGARYRGSLPNYHW